MSFSRNANYLQESVIELDEFRRSKPDDEQLELSSDNKECLKPEGEEEFKEVKEEQIDSEGEVNVTPQKAVEEESKSPRAHNLSAEERYE